MRENLTQTKVAKLKPRAVAYDVMDAVQRGLAVRVRPSGHKAWLVRLQDPETKRWYWWGLGTADEKMIPDVARGLAQDARGQAALAKLGVGSDPRTERQQQAQDKKRTMTLAAFLDDHYLEHAQTHHKSAARGAETVARIKSRFPTLLTMAIGDISTFTVEAWRTARLKAGTTRPTINRDLTALKTALAHAVKLRVLSAHPLAATADFKPLKVDRFGGKTRVLSAAENVALRTALAARDQKRQAARAHHNAWLCARHHATLPEFGAYTDLLTPITLIALATGCRFGELAELRWSDIDLVSALLSVRGETSKAGTGRIIPLNREALSVLTAWIPEPVERDAYVFPGKDGERLVDIKTAWREVLRATNIKDFRFHDCRHTFASRLIANGADINMVRELLGHATVLMTSRYLHTNPTAKAAMVETLAPAVNA